MGGNEPARVTGRDPAGTSGLGTSEPGASRGSPGWRTAWPIAVAGLVVLAAALRFPGLDARGTWDADQGHDMLVLTRFVRDGVWPLLGPPTSIGDFHHGALYYYLLAPAAWLGGGNPATVVGEIALFGVAAVGLVAWLARSVAGPVAGLAAGLVMAVSASAVDESTFLWNPNLVAFTSALVLATGWRAWTSRQPGWWLVTAAALAATMQCHVLGVVLVPPVAIWLGADIRRRSGSARLRFIGFAIAGVAIVAASYLPLLVSELQTDFHESRAAISFFAGGGQSVAIGPVVRLLFVTFRILAWPLTGLLTASLAVGVLAATFVIAAIAWRLRARGGHERELARWIGATLLWSCVALGLGTAGLATVTPLPVDHYHAFLDPIVFVAVGLGIGGLWGLRASPGTAVGHGIRQLPGPPAQRYTLLYRPGVVAAIATVASLVAWNLTHLPPAIAADGGYPAAATAAGRIAASTGERTFLIASLPEFKTPEAYLYPLREIGAHATDQPADVDNTSAIVVVCDAQFVPDCGGAAEDALVGRYRALGLPEVQLVDRFAAAAGRTISVFRATTGST